MFFEVTKPLNSDESFDIKTSTMTAGIRGTSGYVFFDEEGRDSIIVTDGSVIITATNPETGETKYAEVCAGEKLTVYLYSDREENTVSFEIENVVEENLPALPLKMITENEELLNKVCEYTGWDMQKLLAIVSDKPVETEPVEEDPTPTPEEAVAEEPTPTPEEEICSREGWDVITAVRENRILNLPNNELSRPGPRLADGARMLYDFVTGEGSVQNAA